MTSYTAIKAKSDHHVISKQPDTMKPLTLQLKSALIAGLVLLSMPVLAQKSTKEIKADKLFENYSFSAAAAKYEAVDGLTIEGKRRLAEAYLNTQQYGQSKLAYEQFITSYEATAEDMFNYASVLRIEGDYVASADWMTRFKDLAPNDARAINYTSDADQLAKIQADGGQFEIKHLEVNSAQQDFGPAYYKDMVVFASSREGVKAVKRNYNWNGKPFLDMYLADQSSGKLKNPRKFTKRLNNKLHEGPASFNGEGDFMAFTRNNYDGKSADGVVKLQLFFSAKADGEWGEPEPYALNSSEYSVGHPWLSADGKTMYFASDMPGGFGGVDIYRVSKIEDGWSTPINLGKNINTEGNEMFPFVHETGKMLFFASNGHISLGGLDVFVAPLNDGNAGAAQNIGAPLNSKLDDFALILDPEMKSGFFSSNRTDGSGDDDIYAFNLLKPFNFGKIIRGTSRDKAGDILANASINLYNDKGEIVETVLSNENGMYEFMVDKDKDWVLSGNKEDYFEGKNMASTATDEEVVIADLMLEKDPGLSLFTVVTDKQTGAPVPNVSLTLINKLTGVEEKVDMGANAEYLKPLADNKLNDKVNYDLRIEAPGYLAKTANYTAVLDREGRYDIHKTLDLQLDKITEGETRLEDLIDINPIYFDLGKYKIRPDAAIELEKIIQVMNENLTMVIELGSHTDCRSSYSFNEKLSDDRAKASAAYIKKKITNPDRIYGKGYGESQLKVDCPCEGAVKSTCSEEEHQKNRRTEFKIIKM